MNERKKLFHLDIAEEAPLAEHIEGSYDQALEIWVANNRGPQAWIYLTGGSEYTSEATQRLVGKVATQPTDTEPNGDTAQQFSSDTTWGATQDTTTSC